MANAVAAPKSCALTTSPSGGFRGTIQGLKPFVCSAHCRGPPLSLSPPPPACAETSAEPLRATLRPAPCQSLTVQDVVVSGCKAAFRCSRMSSAAALPPRPTCGIGLVLADSPDGVVIRCLNPLGSAAQSKADILPNGNSLAASSHQTNSVCVMRPLRPAALRRRQLHRNLRLCEGARSRTGGYFRESWS